MDAEQLLEAAQLYYERYWFFLSGYLNGVELPRWNDLSEDQVDAMIEGLEEVETYIAGLE